MNKKALHDFTLRARKLLISEVEELLEAVYGLHTDGTFESVNNLPAISTDKNTKNTRARLEKFLIDESKAGLRGRDAYEKLVKETAFTWLNRFIAFKMMEVRRLIRQTITKGTEILMVLNCGLPKKEMKLNFIYMKKAIYPRMLLGKAPGI